MTSTSNIRENRGRRVVVFLVFGLILVFGGGYAVAAGAAGSKLPKGTTVAGIEVGGQTAAEAEQSLLAGLAERETRPIEVTIGDKTAQITPSEAGITVDTEATLAALGGGSNWSPGKLWNYYTGGSAREPVLSVDRSKMSAALNKLADADEPAVNGEITFRAGRVVASEGTPGQGVDPAAAEAALSSAFVADDASVELTLGEVAPDIDATDVSTATTEFADPAVSGPATLTFEGAPIALTAEEIGTAVQMKAAHGALVGSAKPKVLRKLIESKTAGKGAPVPATVRLVQGKPQVVPSKPGVTFTDDAATTAFLAAILKSGAERTATVASTVQDAKFNTEAAEKLGIKEQVSTFTTEYPHAEYRNTNIGRAAEIVNGTVLKPGETFSLNGIVGERTVENGFTTGFIISDGVFREDLGGGVSQMATTTYNAAFFAGFKDVEHKPHSFYIDRYPEGREATVAWPTVDMAFQNDTDYGVLVQSYITPSTPSSSGSVTVTMWSTKVWDISTKTGERYNFTSPGTRVLPVAGCTSNSGYGGFDIDYWRYFKRPGQSQVVKTEKYTTTYTPADTVICRDPEPEPAPEPPAPTPPGN